MLLSAEDVASQQYVFPIATSREPSLAVVVDSVRLTVLPDSTSSLSMSVCVVGSLPKGERVTVTPVLTADDDTLSFPPMAILGRWSYYHEVRDGFIYPNLNQSIYYRDTEMRTFQPYRQSVAYQPWMGRATLRFSVVRADGCGTPLVSGAPRLLRRFSPLLAVKTNLLYDAALAPNVEVEVPLGRRGRWSIMAEYCNPWWRWDRKSYSYQIQMGGVELRRWFAPRCDDSRPALSGHFWGIYGAFGQYDLERRNVGDQGEAFSAGVTYGYSWPLGRRLNLEASVSAGVLFGERRHYNAEFESTHLIYKYTKNLFYAGPTKVKLSLVWMLGKTKN